MPDDPALQKLAKQIASHLGSTWTAKPDTGWGGMLLVDGTGPDAPTLSLGRDRPWTADAGRLVLHGVYPRNREQPYNLDRPEITVAASKPPVRIAGDIARRLLPGYRTALAKVIAYDQQEQARYERRQAAAERIAALLPGARVAADRRSSNAEVSWWADYKSPADRTVRVHAKVDYNGQELLELELSAVPLDLAEEILKLVPR